MTEPTMDAVSPAIGQALARAVCANENQDGVRFGFLVEIAEQHGVEALEQWAADVARAKAWLSGEGLQVLAPSPALAVSEGQRVAGAGEYRVRCSRCRREFPMSELPASERQTGEGCSVCGGSG